ncbi:MAG: ketopantoate reductase family protein [Propionicimonas sp.]
MEAGSAEGVRAVRVAVVGLGAIGAAYAERLVAAGVDVEVVVPAERVARYRNTRTSVNGTPCGFALVTPEEAAPADVLLVAVKHPQLTEAIEAATPVVTPATVVLSLLNGISSEEDLAAAFPEATVLLALAVGIDAQRAGREVRYSSLGRIVFGEPANTPPHTPAVRRVAALFDLAGIPYEVPVDMVRSLWWKFLVNVGVNQVSAVLRAPYGAFQADGSPARRVMLAAQREVIAVANARGIDLGEDDLRRWLTVLDGLHPAGYSSMAQDTIAGRETEVGIFGGAIVALGAAAGIPVPVNATLAGLLEALAPRAS